MNVVTRTTPHYTVAKNRPVNGIVLHHTATTTAVMPHQNGSWHYLIGRDGVIYADVPEQHVAWHVANTNKWRPPWVVPSKVATSDMNYCSLGVELAYAPQEPHFQVPTQAQVEALRELLADIYQRRGRLPIVGHGEVQSDKWASEPHLLNWGAAGIGPRGVDGRYFIASAPAPEEPMPDQGIIDEYERQIANLRAEISGLHSAIGATDAHVVQPLTAERDSLRAQVDQLRQELAALQAQPAPMLSVERVSFVTRLHHTDGSITHVPAGFETHP